jgi:hypothetical protein
VASFDAAAIGPMLVRSGAACPIVSSPFDDPTVTVHAGPGVFGNTLFRCGLAHQANSHRNATTRATPKPGQHQNQQSGARPGTVPEAVRPGASLCVRHRGRVVSTLSSKYRTPHGSPRRPCRDGVNPHFPQLRDQFDLRVCPRPQPGEIFIQSHLVLQHGGLC